MSENAYLRSQRSGEIQFEGIIGSQDPPCASCFSVSGNGVGVAITILVHGRTRHQARRLSRVPFITQPRERAQRFVRAQTRCGAIIPETLLGKPSCSATPARVYRGRSAIARAGM